MKDPDGWQPLCMARRNSNNPSSCRVQQPGSQLLLRRAPLLSTGGRVYKASITSGIKLPRNHRRLNRLFNPHSKRNSSSAKFAREYTRLLRTTTAALNDYQKTVAERFAPSQLNAVLQLVIDDLALRGATLAETVRVLFVVVGSMRDAMVVVGTIKTETPIIRPITVLQCGMIGRTVNAVWRGPYQGMRRNVRLSNAVRWEPYIDTPSSAAFPSGHTALAAAGIAAYTGSTRRKRPKAANCMVQLPGASRVEGRIDRGQRGYVQGVTDRPNRGPFTKGFVPAKKVTICWESWFRYVGLNAQSRQYGGIHTRGEVQAGRLIGQRVARAMIAYERRLKKHS